MHKKEKKMGLETFLYRLFFTRDDDMDMLQVMYLICILFFFFSFAMLGWGKWTITPEAWSMYKWVMSILAMTGTPKWVVSMIAGKNAKAIAEVAAPDDDEDKKADDKDKG